jgi:cytochrome c oxidase assembly factor CtaG
MIFSVLHIAMATVTISSLLSLAFLLPERSGFLISDSRTRQLLPLFSGLWLLSAMGNVIATLASLFDQSFFNSFDLTTIYSFLSQTSLGRLQFIEVLAGLAIFLFSSLIKKIDGAFFLLLIAIIGVTAPVFESHSSSLGSHGLAIGSLVIHVVAITLWIGAVLALAMMSRVNQTLARPRVSVIALWASIAVATSGVANAWSRLRFNSDWFSTYGALIGVKATLFLVVLILAQRIRKSATLERLLVIEVAILFLILTLGSILNGFVPIDQSEGTSDRAQQLIGVPMPAAPTFSRVSWAYEADGLILGILIFATALYIKGVLTLSRRGDSWPKGRTISFAIGIALLDFATNGGVGLYARFSFQFHMIAHMILSMIAPIALVLSAPVTLALRALPSGRSEGERGLRGALISALHSLPSRIWTHPLVALAIFDGSLFALYFTPLFGELMSSHFGHLVMTFHFLGAGLLFFFVIVGVDPNPRKVPHLARVVILLAAISIHSFFSVALMSANDLIDGGYFAALQRPWATNLLSDQKLGAAIGWAMGEIPIVVALIATFIQWMRSDARDAKRADRRSESELAEYNAYLAELAERGKKS